MTTEKVPTLKGGRNTQAQGAQRAPSKKSPHRPTARHILAKMLHSTDKERISKAAREKQFFTSKGGELP